jgi:DNA-binding NarL/FixJ family response regulator
MARKQRNERRSRLHLLDVKLEAAGKVLEEVLVNLVAELKRSDLLELLHEILPKMLARTVEERFEVALTLHSNQHLVEFTQRERDVLESLAKGLCDKDVAEETGMSRFTVATHLRQIRMKTGLSSRLEMALFATAHADCW